MMGDNRHSMDISTMHHHICHILSSGIICIIGVLSDFPAHVANARAFHRYQYVIGIVVIHRS